MPACVVYVLESESTGRLYVGQTSDLERRLHEHGTGQVRSTKGRGPWRLLASRRHATRAEAVAVERRLKAFKNPRSLREDVATW